MMKKIILSILITTTLAIIVTSVSNDIINNNNMLKNQDLGQKISKFCECYTILPDASVQLMDIECRCYGKNFTKVPPNLREGVQKITITDSDIRFINRDSFQPYKDSLMDVTLGNLLRMTVIEKGTFRDLPKLRTLYITNVPGIKVLPMLLYGVTTKKFLTLRITHTELHEIPKLDYLPPENILHMLDLEGNKIDKLTSNSIKIKAEQVIFNYNEISFVDDYAFNGSQIARLSFSGNKKLTTLRPYAFAGVRSLRHLDLSGTSIENLHTVGLQNVEELKVQRTPSMKTIPSIFELKSLKVAYLTHPFHCCAFRYPEQHDPVGYAQHHAKVKQRCETESFPFDTGQRDSIREKRKKKRRKRRNTNTNFFDPSLSGWTDQQKFITYKPYSEEPERPEDWMKILGSDEIEVNNNLQLVPLKGNKVGFEISSSSSSQQDDEDDFGTFHQTSANLTPGGIIEVYCGNISSEKREIFCYPEPNALNPCEDIMGFEWLRVSVWFVVVLSISGNLLVIVVLLLSRGGLNVSKFLMCNLAFADICLGLFLLLTASMDLHSVGSYFNFAYHWQYGLGCQITGFLTVFASHLSIYTLTVITLERWFAITFALHLTKRIRLKPAIYIMIGGWLYSILMAALPLFGISNYSSTSICLPMEVDTVVDKVYLITVFLLNGIAFAIIVFCYAQIYLSLGYETRRSGTSGEMTIAKKMALLVFTDFACWAPVTFFSLTALAGYPLIGVTESKILLVFFFPLNACANPYLYAIMTAPFRKDLFDLLSRCGICSNKKPHHYTTATSILTQNNSHPIPLLTKSSNGDTYIKNCEIPIEDDHL